MGGFSQDDQAEAGGGRKDGGFESPEEPGEGFSLGGFVGGGFGSESGVWISWGDGVFVPAIFDKLLGIVLLDVGPDFFDVAGDLSIQQFQFFDLPDGLFQQGFEEAMLHPLDLLSEVAVGGEEVFPVDLGGRLETLRFGSKAYKERQGGMFQEEGSQAGEGLDVLIHHHEVGFEEGFQREVGRGKGRQKGEVEDVKEALILPHEGVILEEVLEGWTLAAGCCVGTCGSFSEEATQEVEPVSQHEPHAEDLQPSEPAGGQPGLGLGSTPSLMLLFDFFPQEDDFLYEEPLLGKGGRRKRGSQENSQDAQATQKDSERGDVHTHGIAPFALKRGKRDVYSTSRKSYPIIYNMEGKGGSTFSLASEFIALQ